MSRLDAVKIVESFRADMWAACDPEAVDRYVVEDFSKAAVNWLEFS